MQPCRRSAAAAAAADADWDGPERKSEDTRNMEMLPLSDALLRVLAKPPRPHHHHHPRHPIVASAAPVEVVPPSTLHLSKIFQGIIMSSGLCCIKWIPESEHLAAACNPATTATLWVKVCCMSNNADYSAVAQCVSFLHPPPPHPTSPQQPE